MGNVHGRVEGANANAEALLIGSHMVMHLYPQNLFQFSNKTEFFLDN